MKSIEYNVFRAKRERKSFPFVCSVEKLFLSLHPQVPQPSVAYEKETSYRGSKIRNLCIITKWKVTKRHSDALYNGCEGKSLNDEDLLDVIFATYNKQLSKGWIKYIHGTTLIMCHMKSSNKDFAMYEYNVDTNKMSDFVVAD